MACICNDWFYCRRYYILYVYYSLFIHSSIEGRLTVCSLEVIMNEYNIKILQVYAFISLVYVLR